MGVQAEGGAYESVIGTGTNLTTAGGPYYYPTAAGMDHRGFKNWSVDIVGTCGAGNTYTFTVEVLKVIGGTWIDVTKGGSDVGNGTTKNATYVCPVSLTTSFSVDYDDLSGRYVRVKLVVVDGGGANNSLVLTARDSV